MSFKRYAIYVCPIGDFGEVGARWLGWDCRAGEMVADPLSRGFGEGLTERPRRYGFHGTIKPPFHLAEGFNATDLRDRFDGLCATLKPVTLTGLELAMLGPLFSFVPQGDQTALSQLASEAVRGLDEFRAPPSEEELIRRRKRRLSPSQEENLSRWGYPHVMDDFRFHLTLTGPVPRSDRDAVAESISDAFGRVLPAPFAIDRLSLLGEDDDGMFHVIRDARLGHG